MCIRDRADIVQEKRKAVNELKDEIGGMAMEIAGKVIEREVNEKDHAKLIDDFISQVDETADRNAGDISCCLLYTSRCV